MSSSPLLERAERFRALHQSPGAFVIANAWDGASARILESLGFEAIATSSGAAAATLGRLDGELTREEALAHSRVIAGATSRPVSADLERGFGDSPEEVAKTIRLAAEAGLVGCSIEDATRDPARPLYEIGLATERIAAAAEAARALPFPFTLTARCEHFLQKTPELDETIRRLLAYERAGADVLFAPGLPDLEAVRAMCSVLTKPFNFMAGIRGKSFTVAELAAAGVKRVSLATSLYRSALTGLLAAAREVSEAGTFTYLEHILTSPELNSYLKHS
jgi:2-methylisocitrate lyase-like PEP mutase family enzyme